MSDVRRAEDGSPLECRYPTPEIIARVDAWLSASAQRSRGIGGVPAVILSLGSAWACATHNGAVTDPGDVAAATGILLGMVREVWGDPTIFVRSIPGRDRGPESLRGGWKMTDAEGNSLWCDAGPLPGAATEVEALVAALEAAPAKEEAAPC